jgi:hypothetical protein
MAVMQRRNLPMKRLTITALLVLAACEPVVPAEEPSADACGASGLQDLVGQPKSVLAAMTFPAPTRVIEPGMAVTLDFRADRLNIETNAAELIARVYCG